MVDVQCLGVLNRVGDEYNVAVEDFADRLHLYTSGFFLVSAIAVSLKQYVFSSMSCYIPVHPKEGAFAEFLSNYCWVHGTIPLRSSEEMPNTEEEWDLYDKYRRISFFLVSAIAVSLKQYVFSSMSCYIPVHPKEGAFAEFLSNYCWVHGTIPLRSSEEMPNTEEEWDLYDKYRRISTVKQTPSEIKPGV
ncbi:unnamed protein product [Echinostoma caproni]|uniref:Innexin n=1 Tax=Echinostoma caproni TaxID=27848 RepID=A0A183A5L2_9TREM|nr:unnamed protein product [Echinostoma caproni]